MDWHTISFDLWMEIGVRNGFCGAPICYTHDGLPTTASEDESWGDDDDPCIHIVRMYENADVRQEVEANHSPSVWRRTNQGL
jgi:hypothetical protein